MQSNGKRLRKLRTGNGANPAWSPNGKQIVFSEARDRILKNHALFIVNRDGSGLRQLNNDPRFHHQPAWSPDGEWIAYILWQGRGRGTDVHVINVAGKPIQRLTNDGVNKYFPKWVPEGFLAVSPIAQTQTTLWSRLKKSGSD